MPVFFGVGAFGLEAVLVGKSFTVDFADSQAMNSVLFGYWGIGGFWHVRKVRGDRSIVVTNCWDGSPTVNSRSLHFSWKCLIKWRAMD